MLLGYLHLNRTQSQDNSYYFGMSQTVIIEIVTLTIFKIKYNMLLLNFLV